MPRLAKQVTKEQVITALDHIIKQNLELNGSTVHNLLYKGRSFPPKEVVRWAARLAKIPNWENMGLSGGEDTNAPLRNIGFKIIPKRQNFSKTTMDLSQLGLLKEAYQRYKTTESYLNRQNQFKIVPVNKEIIKSTLAKAEISNDDLTGLIQMFKYRCTDSIFDKYLEQNIPDEKERQRLSNLASNADEWGYTGAGLNSVNGLSKGMLAKVKDFLLGAFSISNVEDAISICSEFEMQNIPQIKSGIFSPWLYYINPNIFPILNNSHNSFRKILAIPQIYSEAIADFEILKHEFGEHDLGMVDLFAYNINDFLQISTSGMEDIHTKHPKNQILYGPPGTGKTYYTINKALTIIEGKTEILLEKENREQLLQRFNKYR